MLSKEQIRVRYSGFVIFASQILSMFTGIIFLLLLTRISAKSPDEFGIWALVFYLVGLFTLTSGLFPFWVTRFVARGKEDAIKTGFLANLVSSLIAVAVYLVFITPILGTFGINNAYLLIYLFASLQIVNTFLITIFEGCLRAVKPQAIGFGLLIEEAVKVSLAYVLVVVLNQLLLGAMISLISGAAVQTIFYGWLLKDELRQGIRWNYLKEWLRGGSAAFVYNAVGTQLVCLLLYVLILFNGQAALGYFQAAVTFSAVVSYAFSLSFALYPKMLAEECPSDVAVSFKTMIMIAFPLATVFFTMSWSLLTVLNADYAAAAPILMLLTVDTLVVLVSQFYNKCLMGTDSIDIEGKIPLRKLVKSRIFKVFSVPYIQAAVALPSLYFVLTSMATADPIQAAEYMVIINIIVHTGAFVGLYTLMRNSVGLPVQWKSIAKYVLGAVVAGLALLAIPKTSTLLATFSKAVTGIAVYIAFLYLIDLDARKLIREIWNELKNLF